MSTDYSGTRVKPDRADKTGAANAPAAGRRGFLAAGVATSLATSLTTSVTTTLAVTGKAEAAVRPSSGLVASDFQRALRSTFHATPLSDATPRTVSLTLVEVSTPPHSHPDLNKTRAAEQVFSLRFSVQRVGLQQDTYLISHAALGDFAALLVPTKGGLLAEFHRL